MLLEEAAGCWPEQQNKLNQRPVDMAAACAVVAARPALSRVYFPPACDLELAQQRRCDAAGGGDERRRQWRAAAERGDADAVRRLVATEPLPETTASDAARDETTKVAGTLAYDPRWPSQQSYAPGDCVFAREAAEGEDEGARWRRGVVTAKSTDGDMTVASEDVQYNLISGSRPLCHEAGSDVLVVL